MKAVDPVKLTQELVRIPSVTGNEDAASDFVFGFLKERLGASNVRKQGVKGHGCNVIARSTKETKGSILLCSHIDTVSPGDESSWTVPPFFGRMVGDKLYGRGSLDAKSNLAAIMAALIRCSEENVPVVLGATVDEEGICSGAYRRVRHPWARDCLSAVAAEPGCDLNYPSFSKDYPTVWHNGAGRVELELSGGFQALRSAVTVLSKRFPDNFQPTSFDCVPEEPEQGLLVESPVGTAHAALTKPEDNVILNALLNASSETASGMKSIADSKDAGLSLPKNVTLFFGKADGTGTVKLDYYPAKEEDVLELFKRETDGLDVSVNAVPRDTPYLKAWNTPAGVARHMTRNAFLESYGKLPKLVSAPSPSDANVLSTELGVPTIVFGTKGCGVHSPDEWVSVQSIKETTEACFRVCRGNHLNNP